MNTPSKDYEIQIEIENQCYLNCLHCSSLRMRTAPETTMSGEDLLNLLSVVKNPGHVYFTGGEPLASAQLEKLIQSIKYKFPGTKVGIFTCGILSQNSHIDKSYADHLKRSGLDDCYLSLYHYREREHDYVTNKKGSYNLAIKSLKALIEAEIDVKVHLVVNKYNYKELDEVVSELLNLGMSEVRLLRLVKTGAAADNWYLIGISYEEQNLAIMKIIREIQKYRGRVSVSGFPEHFPCRVRVDAVKCQAGTNLMYVTHSGQLFPCACTKGDSSFYISNIRELDIIEEYIDNNRNLSHNDRCLNPVDAH